MPQTLAPNLVVQPMQLKPVSLASVCVCVSASDSNIIMPCKDVIQSHLVVLCAYNMNRDVISMYSHEQ